MHSFASVESMLICMKATSIGDEGGFAPPISQPHEALDLLVEAVEAAGYTGKIKFAMDPASSEFFREGQYDLGIKDKTSAKLSPAGLSDLYRNCWRSTRLSCWKIPSQRMIGRPGRNS